MTEIRFAISVCLVATVSGHVCVLKKYPDPSNGGKLRWSLPSMERCICQGVVAPSLSSRNCGPSTRLTSTDLWFIDDPRLLTQRSNWNKQALDTLLERSAYCSKSRLVIL